MEGKEKGKGERKGREREENEGKRREEAERERQTGFDVRKTHCLVASRTCLNWGQRSNLQQRYVP